MVGVPEGERGDVLTTPCSSSLSEKDSDSVSETLRFLPLAICRVLIVPPPPPPRRRLRRRCPVGGRRRSPTSPPSSPSSPVEAETGTVIDVCLAAETGRMIDDWIEPSERVVIERVNVTEHSAGMGNPLALVRELVTTSHHAASPKLGSGVFASSCSFMARSSPRYSLSLSEAYNKSRELILFFWVTVKHFLPCIFASRYSVLCLCGAVCVCAFACGVCATCVCVCGYDCVCVY